MFFDKNVAALGREPRNAEVIRLLKQTEAATEVGIYETGDQGLTLEHRSVFLHDPKGALKEARDVCAASCHPGRHSSHVLLGLGLGYLLKETFERSPGKIYIYEPDIPLLRFVLENVDLSEYLGSGRVYVSGRSAHLLQHLGGHYVHGDNVDVMALNGYAQLMADEIPTLMQSLVALVEDQSIGFAIGANLNLSWIEHFIRNIPQFANTRPFDLLLNRFADKPALIVCAGPSLDKSLPDIKAMADSVVIIAVGRALRPLMEAGIIPDFAAFLDYAINDEHFKDLPHGTEDITFLLGPFAGNGCYQQPCREQFLVSLSNYPNLSGWIDAAMGGSPRARIPSGGTVSYMATQCALAMGCNPVIMVGQDLAFQKTQRYAGGVHVEMGSPDTFVHVDKGNNVEVTLPLADIRGQNGETLKTSLDYFWFARHFEDFARANAESPLPKRLINASVGGAFLEGYEHLSLAEFKQIESLNPIAKLPLVSPQSYSSVPVTEAQQASLQKAAQRLLEDVNVAIQRAEAALEKLRTLLSANPSQFPQLDAEFRKARAAFSDCLNREPFLSSCLQKEHMTLIRRYQPDASGLEELRQNLEVDAEFYAACLPVLREKILPWVTDTLMRLNATPVVERCLS